jgi:hypothetical protein
MKNLYALNDSKDLINIIDVDKSIRDTRWVKLDYLNFNIIYWSVKDKFIDKLD